MCLMCLFIFFFKQKTAYEMRISDWSSDVCSSDLRTEGELRHLVGTGVSAAAIWYLRENLDRAGFPNVRIVASSGFTPEKCHVMALAQAPVDIIDRKSVV